MFAAADHASDTLVVIHLAHTRLMPHLSAETKRAILLAYRSRSPTHSLAALARRQAVKGGGEVVRR
jgi:hypothetical protein